MKILLSSDCRAFTMNELLVTMGIVSIVAVLLFAAVGVTSQTSKDAKCLSNLRQIGAVLLQYAGEHDNYLPAPANSSHDRILQWPAAIAEYDIRIKKSSLLICPSDTDPNKLTNGYSYAMNGHLNNGSAKNADGHTVYHPLNLLSVLRPSEMIFFADSIASQVGRSTGPQYLVLRHKDNTHFNAVFLDGHVASLTPEQAPIEKWRPVLQK